jgi:hypothetical protein
VSGDGVPPGWPINVQSTCDSGELNAPLALKFIHRTPSNDEIAVRAGFCFRFQLFADGSAAVMFWA